jgi:cytochrome P450
MGRLPGPRTPWALAAAGLRVTRNPRDLLWMYERYGPIVGMGNGPFRFVYLLGPEANEFILSSGHDQFEWREAFKGLIPVDGDTALVVSDGEDHARRRRLVQPAFGIRQVNGYLPIIADEATRSVDRIEAAGEIDLHAEMKDTVRSIAIRTLFGDALGERSAFFGEQFEVGVDYANLPPYLQFTWDLPFTRYRRTLRAMRALDDVVYAEIRRRRSDPGDEADLLSALLESAEDGDGLTDEEIRDQVVSLIAAGFETTSAFATWTVFAIQRHPEVLARVRAEIEVAGDGPITHEALSAMPYLDAVLDESLRLHGPAPISARYAPDGFTFLGHRVRPKSRVLYSPFVTHRLPEHWDEPLAFRPERWLGGERPPAHVFTPFGGGYRRCIGFAMATLEVKVLMVELFRRLEIELLTTDPKPTGLASMYPKHGLRVRATPTAPA